MKETNSPESLQQEMNIFILLKQAYDEYNNDGLDALYHHLVVVLYEIGCRITMKYSSALYPSLSSPTLIHAMRHINPMICLII